jgi:hypothetical protein
VRLARASALAAALVLASGVALAQTGGFGGSSGSAAANMPMGELIADGYEIKASSPSGNKFVVFLQKGEQAYACEFVTLTNSRCGAIE